MIKEDFEKIVADRGQTFDTTLVFAANALAGEVGEVCNVAKKMKYYEHFPTYNTRVDKEVAEGKRIAHNDALLDECGDTLFYLIQVLQTRGFTLEECMQAQKTKLEDYDGEFSKHFTK